MKKRNFRTLNLNKKTISKFEQEEIKGGVTPIVTWAYSKLFCEEKKEQQQVN